MFSLLGLVFATHQLKLEARVFVEADNADDDLSGLEGSGQVDHGHLTIVS